MRYHVAACFAGIRKKTQYKKGGAGCNQARDSTGVQDVSGYEVRLGRSLTLPSGLSIYAIIGAPRHGDTPHALHRGRGAQEEVAEDAHGVRQVDRLVSVGVEQLEVGRILDTPVPAGNGSRLDPTG